MPQKYKVTGERNAKVKFYKVNLFLKNLCFASNAVVSNKGFAESSLRHWEKMLLANELPHCISGRLPERKHACYPPSFWGHWDTMSPCCPRHSLDQDLLTIGSNHKTNDSPDSPPPPFFLLSIP